MSRFTDATYEVTGLFKKGRPVVVLTSPMVYIVDHMNSGWAVRAEVGFCTDLASVPVLPRWLLRFRVGRALYRARAWCARRLARAALPHDVCRENLKMSKLIGDYVFWEAMGVDKVPMWLRVMATALAIMNQSRN